MNAPRHARVNGNPFHKLFMTSLLNRAFFCSISIQWSSQAAILHRSQQLNCRCSIIYHADVALFIMLHQHVSLQNLDHELINRSWNIPGNATSLSDLLWCLNIEMASYQSIQSCDRLIFNMGITKHGKDGLYWATCWFCNNGQCLSLYTGIRKHI